MNITWDKPEYFWLLILIPLVIYAFYHLWTWRRSVRSTFADRHLWNTVFNSESKNWWSPSFLLLIFCILLMILSIVGPKWDKEEQVMRREGIDLVIALDVSNSMNAEDIAPSRLEKSKMFIQKFLDKLGGDRVGLIIYAGDAYTVSPLTNDYAALTSFIEGVDTNLLWTQGTDIGTALKEAIKLLDNQNQTSKALVLISDGEDHEEDFDKSIALADDNDLMVFSFGVGTTKPSPIPMFENGLMIGYKEDTNGNTVLSKFHGENLRKIANATNGSYHKIEVVDQSVDLLLNDLSSLEKKAQSETTTYNAKHQYQWFTGLALLLLLIYTLFSENLKFIKSKNES